MNAARIIAGVIQRQPVGFTEVAGRFQRLLDEGKHYFLSRPRRFGKGFFLDTLKELFAGLHIHAGHDFENLLVPVRNVNRTCASLSLITPYRPRR